MINSIQFRRTIILPVLLGLNCLVAQAEPRIGVQLWSVKDEVKQDFEGTLAKIARLGAEGVEFAGEFGRFRTDPAGLKAFLDKTGLVCAGAHLHFDALNPANIDATTAFYKKLDCRNLIIAMDARAATKEGALQISRELSALSAQLAAHGMKIGYHNHAVEMAGVDGQTTWDLLAANTPRESILQQDVGWTAYAGKDPVAYVKRYPGRTVTIHYKAKFLKGTSGVPIIGQDRADWAGLTQAVRSVGGTDWLILEQEEYPNGMGQFEAVAASMRGLQAVLARLPAR